MHRPLRFPLYLRLWHLIRGIFFYNTVYWKKASDELKMPSLTREERERLRPARDLEIIRPRGKPRARIERSAEVSIAPPPSVLRGGNPAPPTVSPPVPTERAEPRAPEAGQGTADPPREADGSAEPKAYVKRKRYRRKYFRGFGGGLSGRG